MTRILIAGCGFLGRALGRNLAAAGHEVFGLCRTDAELPAGVRLVQADLTRPPDLAVLPKALDVVFYTAGAGRFDEAIYRGTYVDGPRNLLRCLRERGESPRRLFFTSSTAVYGQSDGAWVDESSATEPGSLSGRILLEGEALFRNAGLPATILRLGGLYGPGRDRLVREVREGRARLRNGPPQYTNRIHRDDAAGALQHLLAHPTPESVFLGVDDEPADRNEVLGWLAGALGVAEPAYQEPSPGTTRAASNKRCRNACLRASGYAFRYPSFRDGYRSMLQGNP